MFIYYIYINSFERDEHIFGRFAICLCPRIHKANCLSFRLMQNLRQCGALEQVKEWIGVAAGQHHLAGCFSPLCSTLWYSFYLLRARRPFWAKDQGDDPPKRSCSKNRQQCKKIVESSAHQTSSTSSTRRAQRFRWSRQQHGAKKRPFFGPPVCG